MYVHISIALLDGSLYVQADPASFKLSARRQSEFVRAQAVKRAALYSSQRIAVGRTVQLHTFHHGTCMDLLSPPRK